MLKTISVLIFIFTSCLGVFAQTENYTAPVKWERYKVSDKDVSISFPKLPVFNKGSGSCSEQANNFYATYAEDAVYTLRIVYKIEEKLSKFCPQIAKFDENSFNSRVEEIKSAQKNLSEIKFNQNALEILKIKGDFLNYWLINDFKNKRWFELSVVNKSDDDATVKNYIESLKIEKNPVGIEIGRGANRTLGDEKKADAADEAIDSKAANSNNGATEGVKIISKFAPPYTDAARQSQTQGVVRLRVTFLASGGIGSVSAVSGLPYGLTEEAVAAASKIVFLPARRNGIKIHTIRIIEYNFSIY